MKGRSPKISDILYLFYRPGEPVFTGKGDENVVFDISENYLTDPYKYVAQDVLSIFGEGASEHISVPEISTPDISGPMQLGRQEQFSLLLPHHSQYASQLIKIFMDMQKFDDFLSAAVYCRDRINPMLFIYALSVAILHRPETRNLAIPPLVKVFPEKYIEGAVLSRAREQTYVVPSELRLSLETPWDQTASDLEPEHRLAYFREDVGINLHHWHWHCIYPADIKGYLYKGYEEIVNKDRRGELFFYMHQQIIARYNFERFCNHLARVKRLLNWREPLEEGYFPKLTKMDKGHPWPSRYSNAVLSDIYREVDKLKLGIQDLERWRDRIYEAIHMGRIINDKNENVNLTEMTGIDVLGNIVEASILSPNRNLYGNLHNMGHNMIALCHDPDGRHLEEGSVMGDPATAMRDPIFYRWHAFIDDIFQEHKNTLPRYTVQQLEYSGVTIPKVEVITRGAEKKNEFITYWKQDGVDVSPGINFTRRGPCKIKVHHLQHTPFTYRIQVENNSNSPRMGTVRIFLAPQKDERGCPFQFVDQKGLFIELDKFTVPLKPQSNIIERESTQSSVTIPFDRTFRELDENRPTDPNQLEESNFCGCGWPQHMLIPKGKPEGMNCQLFVMVSNYDDDKVDQTPEKKCAEAASYCGLRDKLYPDKRSMGYPFDRLPRKGVDTLEQFLTPNMKVENVKIRFENSIEEQPCACNKQN